MDISTVLTSLVSSGIVSVGAARWLTKRFIDHRLTKDLKDHQEKIDARLAISKAELDGQVAIVKAEVEADLKQNVEEYLGDKEAERQYRLEARKRLYTAIGPLRFQLVRACGEFANRIDRMGVGQQPYATSLKGYFGRSTMFRLLRLFGITELIERQIADADFSVDPSTIELLRFKHIAFLCLSSSKVSLDHPKVDWNDQVEHVFYDTLSVIAAAMVVSDADGKARVMRFDEFNEFVRHEDKLATIHPIPILLESFTIPTKPILWVRLIALGQVCNAFVKREGERVGIVADPYDSAKLLRASNDEFIVAQHDEYCDMLNGSVLTVHKSAIQSAQHPELTS